jgi:hypothetical protein
VQPARLVFERGRLLFVLIQFGAQRLIGGA